jgi:hypothetical protein
VHKICTYMHTRALHSKYMSQKCTISLAFAVYLCLVFYRLDSSYLHATTVCMPCSCTFVCAAAAATAVCMQRCSRRACRRHVPRTLTHLPHHFEHSISITACIYALTSPTDLQYYTTPGYSICFASFTFCVQHGHSKHCKRAAQCTRQASQDLWH